ncbi:MAG: hypothetical protein IKV66_03960 [Clostridia bacterium]|nr:hypothetical protein [Clostridia bacterium]
MKATGIVRRIDDYVIIGARSDNLENTGVSLILSKLHKQSKNKRLTINTIIMSEKGGRIYTQRAKKDIGFVSIC